MAVRPALLMCPPTYFDVDYVINPWMQGNLHRASRELAETQWNTLYRELSDHADVTLIEPRAGLPDMVFTANAGLVWGGAALLARFRYKERRGEEDLFAGWFDEAAMDVTRMNEPFEGEGDALFAADGSRLWVGHGFRTAAESVAIIAEWCGVDAIPLRFVDPRFYHLDTCFAPLPNGDALYFPPAFDAASLAAIEEYYPPERRVRVSEEDALAFACNVICLDRVLVLNGASAALRKELSRRGFEVIQVDLSEFMKAGGAAKCLVLNLSGGMGTRPKTEVRPL